MRTVEQVQKELEAARVKEAEAAKATKRLEEEMREIYQAAKLALKIKDGPTFRGLGGLEERDS